MLSQLASYDIGDCWRIDGLPFVWQGTQKTRLAPGFLLKFRGRVQVANWRST